MSLHGADSTPPKTMRALAMSNPGPISHTHYICYLTNSILYKRPCRIMQPKCGSTILRTILGHKSTTLPQGWLYGRAVCQCHPSGQVTYSPFAFCKVLPDLSADRLMDVFAECCISSDPEMDRAGTF